MASKPEILHLLCGLLWISKPVQNLCRDAGFCLTLREACHGRPKVRTSDNRSSVTSVACSRVLFFCRLLGPKDLYWASSKSSVVDWRVQFTLLSIFGLQASCGSRIIFIRLIYTTCSPSEGRIWYSSNSPYQS